MSIDDYMAEKKCPLNLSEWVQFLATESTLKRHDYYNVELSLFTKTIILLTIINGVLVLVSILNNFKYIPDIILGVFFVFSCIIFVSIITLTRRYLDKLKNMKSYMDIVIDLQADIICDILNGNLKSSAKIRKRYMDIWDKKLWEKKSKELKKDNL